MEDTLTVLVPTNSEDIPSLISNSEHIVKEDARICPLCTSELKYFYVNFNEQILMCEKVECEYPFGYEDLQFIRSDEGTVSETNSVRTKLSQSSQISPTVSVISTHAWSEIDKMYKVCEDSQLERPCFDVNLEKEKEKEEHKLDPKSIVNIQENVEHIKGLNKELVELSESKSVIKNEKWIKKLLDLQGISGSQLLTPEELKQLQMDKKCQPELKVNIESGNNNTMSIKIDIACSEAN